MSIVNVGYIPADWSGAPSGGNALDVVDSEESGVSVVTLVLEGDEESRAFCDVAQEEGMFAVSAETLCDEEDDEAGRFLDWANECLESVFLRERLHRACAYAHRAAKSGRTTAQPRNWKRGRGARGARLRLSRGVSSMPTH